MKNNHEGLTWNMGWRFAIAVAVASLAVLCVDTLLQAVFFAGHSPIIGANVILTWGVGVILIGVSPAVWFLWRFGPTELLSWAIACTVIGLYCTFVALVIRIFFDEAYVIGIANDVGACTFSLLLNSAALLLFALPDCFVFGIVSWLVLSWLYPAQ